MFRVLYLILLFYMEKVRPGQFCGMLLVTISYVVSMVVVIDAVFDHIHSPSFGLVGWCALVTVLTGTLGTSFLIAHAVFHSETGLEVARRWFSKNHHP
jgi:hypothetical protein